MSNRTRRKTQGFTLVELLVVIGIIALLISILLPSLQSARRSANSVKCLASLKEISNALGMYAVSFKGAWPVAIHSEGTVPGLLPPIPGAPVGSNERRWADLLAPFVSSAEINSAADIDEIRRDSVIWGCPNWGASQEYDPASFADSVRVGYGMQYYPSYFEDGNLDTLAYITTATSTTSRGKYVKATVWGKKGSERAVIADSPLHLVPTPLRWNYETDRVLGYDLYVNPFGTPPIFGVDAARHANPNSNKKEAMSERGVNMNFADGHASSMTPKEAYNAIRSPGQDAAEVFASGGTLD